GNPCSITSRVTKWKCRSKAARNAIASTPLSPAWSRLLKPPRPSRRKPFFDPAAENFPSRRVFLCAAEKGRVDFLHGHAYACGKCHPVARSPLGKILGDAPACGS